MMSNVEVYFMAYIHAICKESEGIRWGIWGKLMDLDYADDICLLTLSTRTMQKMLETLEKESAKAGLKINVKKIKEMRIALNNKEPLCIHNETIERVTQFTYLGSIIDNTVGTEEDIKACIRKAQTAFSTLNKIWHSTTYSTQTKLCIFNTKVKAVLLYGCETWKNSKYITIKLQVFINKSLRKILGIFWPYQITINELWKRMKQPRIVCLWDRASS